MTLINKNKLRALVVKPVIFFIRQAWLILFCTLLLLVLTPLILWYYYNFQPGGYILESLYVFMGDSPSILYKDQADYPNFVLGLLLALRCASWLIMPLVLAIVLDEGQKMIEGEKEKLKQATTARIARGEKMLQDGLEQWRKELKAEGVSQEAIDILASDDD